MPEQTPIPTEDSQALEPAAAEGKSPLLTKIKMLVFVMIVVVVECIVAGLYLPSVSETAEMANPGTGGEAAATIDQHEPQEDAPADQVEVDLGEFTVTAFQPISSTTLRIDFHLFATVGVEDENEFLKLMEGNLHRFRDQILATIRSAEMSDFTEPGLGLIKRRILERTNKTLGKPLLRVVMFSDFSFIEQ